MEAGAIALYIIGLVIGVTVLWLIIEAAVKGALREHQEWLDTRDAPAPTPITPKD